MPVFAYIPFLVLAVAVGLVVYAVIHPFLKRYKIVKAQPARPSRRKKKRKKRKGVWIRVL